MLEYPEGATPLDADDAAALLVSHITTMAELNEWEFENVAKGEEWVFSTKHRDILSMEFLLHLHKRMFGDTWKWAGYLRRKDVQPIGVSPEQIRIALANLFEDVKTQLACKTLGPREIAARFHHRLVAIHPFPNGNGRFSRTITDVLLVQLDQDRFVWGAHLEKEGEARSQYISALRAADKHDLEPLFSLVGVSRGT